MSIGRRRFMGYGAVLGAVLGADLALSSLGGCGREEESKAPKAPEAPLVVAYELYGDKFEMEFYRQSVELMRKKRRANPRNPTYFIADKDEDFSELAKEIRRIGKENKHSAPTAVMDFVTQNVKYTDEKGEYPKFPTETLVDKAGDCEDYVFLAGRLLSELGYDVGAVYEPDHAMLAVACRQGALKIISNVEESKEVMKMARELGKKNPKITWAEIMEEAEKRGIWPEHPSLRINGKTYWIVESTSSGWGQPKEEIDISEVRLVKRSKED